METPALAALLAVGPLAVPLAAGAPPTRKVYQVGVLLYGDPGSASAIR
jgi:hypothetical protein